MNQNCKKVQSYNILGLNELNESLFDIITNVSCSVFFFCFQRNLGSMVMSHTGLSRTGDKFIVVAVAVAVGWLLEQ